MSKHFLSGLALALLINCVSPAPVSAQNASLSADVDTQRGFVDLVWDEATGRLLFNIEEFDAPFIYQSSLARGVGSNDIGLDRGRLGNTAVVRFLRSGPKVLLVQDNLDYRAQSRDPDERRAVTESFARSGAMGLRNRQRIGRGYSRRLLWEVDGYFCSFCLSMARISSCVMLTV